MNAATQVVIYSTLISLLLTYAWWVHFRVWILQRDLFAIRDQLWDSMRKRGMLNDPDYRETRNGINSMIRFAPYLSLRVMALVLASDTKVSPPSGPLLPEVDAARKKVFNRVFRFLFAETLTGLLLLLVGIAVLPVGIAVKQVQKWVSRIFDSTDVRNATIDDLGVCA